MQRRHRSILATMFIAGFFVTAPVVLLWTAGFRYNAKKKTFEKTGIIRVESSPSGAAIFLDGVATGETTPWAFTRLLPEDYVIRLERDGNLPWEKKVDVRSGETTFATDVVLLTADSPRPIVEDDIAAFAADPNGRRIAYLRNQDGNAVPPLRVADASGAITDLAGATGATLHDPRIAWSPDGERILLTSHDENGLPAALIAATNGDAPTLLHPLLPKRHIENATWSFDGNRIIVLMQDAAFVIAANGRGSAVSIAGSFQTAAAGEDSVILVSHPSHNDGTVSLERAPFNGGERVTLAAFPQGEYRFIGDAGKDRALLADLFRKKILLIDTRNGGTIASFPGTNAAWFGAGRDRLLLWGDYEVSVVEMQMMRRTLVTRVSEPVIAAAWHPSGVAVAYATPTAILAAEIDDVGTRNAYELARFTEIDGLAADDDRPRLLFIGAAGMKRGIFVRDF